MKSLMLKITVFSLVGAMFVGGGKYIYQHQTSTPNQQDQQEQVASESLPQKDPRPLLQKSQKTFEKNSSLTKNLNKKNVHNLESSNELGTQDSVEEIPDFPTATTQEESKSSPSIFKQSTASAINYNLPDFNSSQSSPNPYDFAEAGDGDGVSSETGVSATSGGILANSKNAAAAATSATDKNSNSNQANVANPVPLAPRIKGIVYPLMAQEVVKHHFEFSDLLIRPVYAATCAPILSIHELNPNTHLPEIIPLKSVPLNPDASFNMSSLPAGINLSRPLQYFLKVSGCDSDYSRIVTDFFSDQDISIDSSLLAKVIEVPTVKKINEAEIIKFALITKNLNHNSKTYEEAYNKLSANSQNAADFQTTFGSNINVLTVTKPQIILENVSVIVNEKTISPFSLQSQHWYSGYDKIQVWYLDGNFQITGDNYNFSSSANFQGTHTLKTRIGKNDGANRVDTTIPYEEKNWNITVLDTSPAIAPNFILNASTPSPIAANSLKVDIDTGVNFANCETFSQIAIMESPMIPPQNQFSISCSTQGSQLQNINLSDLTDGAKTLYLWTIDSSSQISATPSTLNFILDKTPPSGSLADAPAMNKGADSLAINFSATDLNGIKSTQLFYTLDNSTYSLIANDPVSPYLWTFPAADTSNARLKFIITDNAGNTTTYLNNLFTIDSTPPAIHGVSLASNLISNSTAISLTSSSCSDTPFVLVNEGIQPASSDISWQACATAAGAITYSIASLEGLHSLKVWFKDSVGNVATTPTALSMTYDITPPALAISSPASIIGGATTEIITFTQTDLHGVSTYKLQFASDGVTFTDIASSPASPYNWIVPTINSSNSRLKIIATDNVGNSSSLISSTFNIDSTPPAAPGISLSSAALTNSLLNTFSASSCTDTPFVLFNEGARPLANDSNWVACTTTPSALNYSIAGTEGSHLLKAWAKDSVGNVSLTSSDFSIIYDITPPTNSLNNLASAIRGGDTVSITFTQSDTNGIASHKLQYASDGTTFVDLISAPISPYSWSIPATNTTTAKIRLITVDNANNTTTKTTLAFEIDSLSPNTAVASLYSAAISSSTAVAITVTDCLDRPFILISESMLAPTRTDPEWQGCNTTAGGLPYVLLGPALQGIHDLYVWSKDSVGNISAATPLSMSYDTVQPALSLTTTMASIYYGGASVTFDFSGSDISGLSVFKLEYSPDGVTFSTVQTFSEATTNYVWTVPSVNTATAKVRLVALDNAIVANSNSITSTSFVIDSTPPVAPSATLASSLYSPNTLVTMTVSTCSDQTHILVNEGTKPLPGDAGWAVCNTTAGGISYTIAATQGLHTLKLWSKDLAGNVSSTSTNLTMTYDSIPPVVNIATISNAQGNTLVPVNIALTEVNASAGQILLVEYFNGSTWTTWNNSVSAGPHNATNFSGSITTPAAENILLTFRASFTDLAGNSTMTSVQFRTDLTPPVVDLLSINGGAVYTANNNLQITLNAHDAISKVTQFCLKYNDSVAPAANSFCWKDVNAPIPGITPNQSISFNNYFYQIGFIKGNYDVYAWAKDETGQISVNSNTLNVDKFNIAYDPETPPVVAKIQVSNTDAPGNPISASDLVAASGSDIYIKWHATDLEGLAANPISIQYSINDLDFYPLAGGANLSNAAIGGCTIDASLTGCIKLAAPVGSYFKIRVVAEDLNNTTVFINSAPLNEGKVKIIAGNTEHGLDGSARSAIFYTYGSYGSARYVTKNRLVISEEGKFFYLDPVRGLLWVDPANGILKVFIPVTGTSTGDGGPVANATLRSASAITLDHFNNLIIWDYNQLRKINLGTMTITHVLGGGASPDPLVTVDRDAIELPAGFETTWDDLVTLPNGDIIFTAPRASLHHRRYRALDQKIELMEFVGTGITSYPATDWSTLAKTELGIAYNSATSEIQFMSQGLYKTFTGDSYNIPARVDHTSGSENTPYQGNGPHDLPSTATNLVVGLDGKIYYVNRFRSVLSRYDHVANTATTILGTGTESSTPCLENTLATSCAISLDSVFISKNSRIYFVDNGVVRTIDDTGKVITLFGEFPSYGDNILATTARFGSIQDINLGKALPDNNKIIVEDTFTNKFREVTIDGNITNLTGANFTWHGPFSFEVDPGTGDILSPVGATLKRFDRNTSLWNSVVGGGANDYRTSDGLLGADINLISGYHSATNGIVNNKVIYNKYYWTGTFMNGCYIKAYDMGASYIQSHIMGNGAGNCGGGINLGGNLTDNITGQVNIGKFRYLSDPADSVSKYIFHQTNSNQLYKSLNGGAIQNFVTLNHNVNSFTYNVNGDGLNLYYCSTDGLLYKYIYNTAQTVPLSWSSPLFKCNATRNIIYHPTRNSVIFPFTQNGLHGIAEYDLNP